jgi:hypothetical protein
MDKKFKTQQADIKYLIYWLSRLPGRLRIAGHRRKAHDERIDLIRLRNCPSLQIGRLGQIGVRQS